MISNPIEISGDNDALTAVLIVILLSYIGCGYICSTCFLEYRKALASMRKGDLAMRTSIRMQTGFSPEMVLAVQNLRRVRHFTLMERHKGIIKCSN